MAAGTTPVFIATPNAWQVFIDQANSALDGTGTIGTLVTGNTNGTRVDKIVIKAAETTTAGMIRFFIDDGTNTRLLHEESVSAVVPSGTVKSFEVEWSRTDQDDLALVEVPAGWSLKVSTENGEDFIIHAEGGDY